MIRAPHEIAIPGPAANFAATLSGLLPEIETAPGWQLVPFSHAGAYQRSPRTQLVAASDPNPERRASFGRRRGVPSDHLYADHREMLARERPDVVSVCVPTRHHAAVALDVAAHPGVKACNRPIAGA